MSRKEVFAGQFKELVNMDTTGIEGDYIVQINWEFQWHPYRVTKLLLMLNLPNASSADGSHVYLGTALVFLHMNGI